MVGMMIELPSFDHIQEPEARALLALQQKIIENLQYTNAQLREALDEQKLRIEKLEAENQKLRRALFGKKSERMPPVDQALEERKKDNSSPEEEQARKTEKKNQADRKRKTNRGKKKALPEVVIEHPVEQEQLHCQACGGSQFEPLGAGEVSYEYEYIPAQLLKRKHVREKKICQCKKTMVTAPAPARVGEKGQHGPGLHAHIVVSKCLDSIPLYRQAKQFQRVGVPLNASTLGDLFHRSAELLKLLHTRLMALIAQDPYVNADETGLPVQQKVKCRKAWVWTFISGTMIAFVYSYSRSGQTPYEVLANTTGKLQVDGHTGYHKVCVPEGRERTGCWAHVRRKFFDAMPTQPRAKRALELILDLYEVEYDAAEKQVLGTDQHLAMRQTRSQDVLDIFHEWLLEERKQSPPLSPMGQAVTYALNQWDTLLVFLQDAKVALDNNIAERALRPIALGRKNFLFVGNDGAGENLAVLQSLVSTCVACEVNPQDYLTDVLLRINTHPVTRIDELLPMNWKRLVAGEVQVQEESTTASE